MNRSVRDPETGEEYFYVGCRACEGATWLVAVTDGPDRRDRRTALICVDCGHAATGRFMPDEPLQDQPERRPA